MAKILSVGLLSIPEVIIINDNHNDFTVVTEIEFHDLDILNTKELTIQNGILFTLICL